MLEFLKNNWIYITVIAIVLAFILFLIIKKKFNQKQKYDYKKLLNTKIIIPKVEEPSEEVTKQKKSLKNIKVRKTNKSYTPPQISNEGYDAQKYANELVEFFGEKINKKEVEEDVN